MARILLILPGCDGSDVGEAWVAFQWARHLSVRNELTVLTYYKRGHRPASQQLDGVRVIEWPEPPGLGRAERFNSMLKPAYLPFYLQARRWIRNALARGERFDVAFQPVPVAMRYPCPAAGLGIPFIIGPVGGSLESPAALAGAEDQGAWYLRLRRLDRFRIRADPWLRRTYDEASCVLGIAPYVESFLAPRAITRFEVMSETGLTQLPEPVDRTTRTGEVRMLFVGRLVPTKGARYAIRALGLVRELPVSLDVVGDGYDRASCEALTAELRLSGRVRFHGRLARDSVDDLYKLADAFLFPSYREPGGNVVFEAMGYGLPLIVSNLGGPGNVVDDASGIRIQAESPDQYTSDIAAAIAKLVAEPRLRLALGAGARARVADVGLWINKAVRLESICNQVMNEIGQTGPESAPR